MVKRTHILSDEKNIKTGRWHLLDGTVIVSSRHRPPWARAFPFLQASGVMRLIA